VTARESEILSWVAAGKSDWAIGQILNISGKTVNFHVENAKRKLGVGTRIQAVVAAMRSGIIGQWASQVVIFAELLAMLA
jgi:DNA-binding CsgD family transcriptional regulator